jgi:hypothetical protein
MVHRDRTFQPGPLCMPDPAHDSSSKSIGRHLVGTGTAKGICMESSPSGLRQRSPALLFDGQLFPASGR